MVNQQLSDYVKQQLQQGKAKEDIKSELLGAGWQEADINQVFGVPDSSVPPKPPSATPSFAPTSQRRLDPRAVWLFFFSKISLFLAAAIWLGLTFFIEVNVTSQYLGIGLTVFFGVIVFEFIWAKLTYHFYRFELTEEGFRKELGVIYKKYVTIPYDRIQNVDINRGILSRMLGLSDLNIQTAGMSAAAGAEGRLPGLSREDAEQLRNELIRRARQTKNQGI